MQQASLPVKYRKEYQEKTNPHYQPPGFENQLNRPFDGVKLNQVYVGAESLLIPGKAGYMWRDVVSQCLLPVIRYAWPLNNTP
ncbi:hypothetical protein SAMN05216318_1474 [Nitrosomonas eutropha]|nr:hypothetical protein SAMN05216318_1474 [Nitrosomonas eutropha]